VDGTHWAGEAEAKAGEKEKDESLKVKLSKWEKGDAAVKVPTARAWKSCLHLRLYPWAAAQRLNFDTAITEMLSNPEWRLPAWYDPVRFSKVDRLLGYELAGFIDTEMSS